MRSRAFALACFVSICPFAGLEAHAAGPIFNVNSFSDVVDAAVGDAICDADPGPATACTLRAAVMEAQFYWVLGGTEEVTINLQLGTYDLTIPIGVPDDGRNGDLNLYGKIRFVGKGGLDAPATIIGAKHGDRLFWVSPSGEIKFENLRIDGGRPPDDNLHKGDGGGIYNNGGDISLTRCLVRDCDTTSGYAGGGIYSNGGTVVIRESNFRLNHAWIGGAIAAQDTAVTIVKTTLNLNDASTSGGAISVYTCSLDISNSTISDNYAVYNGGGCWVDTAAVRLNNVTLAINRADGPAPAGGGIWTYGTTTVAFSNSILLNTRQNLAYDDLGCGPSTTASSNGHNLIAVTNGCPINGATSSAPTGINPLAGNGGLTSTRALTASSPALNAGKPTGCEEPFGAPMTTDQRGVKRPIGSACDLGAFEAEPIGDANGDGIVSVADVLYLINYLFAGGPVPLGRANVNGGDGSINVSDVLYLINHLFAGGPAPA